MFGTTEIHKDKRTYVIIFSQLNCMKEGVKMFRTPIDCEPRKTGSKARAIVHYKLNAEHWDYREETGNDYG